MPRTVKVEKTIRKRFRVTSNRFFWGEEAKASHIQVEVEGREALHKMIDELLGKYEAIKWLKLKLLP